jgi:hypothetical protein
MTTPIEMKVCRAIRVAYGYESLVMAAIEVTR